MIRDPNRPFNILITAASRRVAMVRGFAHALEQVGVAGTVQVTDTDPYSTGLRFAHKGHMVPLSGSPAYLPSLLTICEKEDISLIVPTIDEELPSFGKWREEFVRRGVTPLVSESHVGAVCRDKYATYRWFADRGFPFAPSWLPSEIDFAAARYPLFIKPRQGRGSVGIHRVDNERALKFFLDYVENPIVQTYLTGDEYTVDALAGLDGRILSVVPRQRLIIRSGVCDRGVSRNNRAIIEISQAICEALNVVGPVNLQMMWLNGKATFFEINPRFSGAIQLTVAAGADFFRLIVEEALGRRPPSAIGDFADGVMMMSYEESIFETP
jgi:carbamoyl-phosphate synthase large subunit